MSASSGEAADGRLHQQAERGSDRAWSIWNTKVHQNWLQVDLRNISKVTVVTTQGIAAFYLEWVTTYTIEYSLFGSNFFSYKVNGTVQVSIALVQLA